MPNDRNPKRYGLIGTITLDHVSYQSGGTFVGLGGVLYQAAALCGLGEQVSLFSRCGRYLQDEVERTVAGWAGLRREGLVFVAGPGNQVRLHYPDRGERREVLESVVAPLGAKDILSGLDKIDMLMLVINSGFDIELAEWRAVMAGVRSPVWLDVHSLALFPSIGVHRDYRPLPEWTRWAEGVTYLQANLQEVACMMGHPERFPDDRELKTFARLSFDLGVSAVFVTLGKAGARVLAPSKSRKIRSRDLGRPLDSTGCGDIFCAGTMACLIRGADPFKAAAFGVSLASRGVTVSGIRETYRLTAGIGAAELRKM